MEKLLFDPADPSCLNLHVLGRILATDAARQAATAKSIIKRFQTLPGIILADEVGMGKTFVALAVAATVHFNDPEHRPVVVMVPPALARKWPRDARVFRDVCLGSPWKEAFTFTTEPIENGIALLKTFDDTGNSRRKSVVFVTHGALYRSMGDAWVKLAILRRALHKKQNVGDIRHALARFAGDLVNKHGVPDAMWAGLLARDPKHWLAWISRNFKDKLPADGDDPVPLALWEAIKNPASNESLQTIRKLLDQIPKKRTAHYAERVIHSRKAISKAINAFWGELRGRLDLKLPLLIFDEAHHLKNSKTQLVRSLFQDDSHDDEAVKGTFRGVFSRMLFLTATPFQLGHNELLSVLGLFESIDWDAGAKPGLDKDRYRDHLEALRCKLDKAQEEGLALDRAWGRLSLADLIHDDSPEDADTWYAVAEKNPELLGETAAFALRQVDRTNAAMRQAEALLKPLVARHLKGRTMEFEGRTVQRRSAMPGRGIVDPADTGRGLGITNSARLPFLLAARTVAINPRGHAVYADGLASSYEAFLNTHRNNRKDSEEDDSCDDQICDARIQWYADAIKDYLEVDRSGGVSLPHPKLQTTTAKALDLWKQGEKVVVFCHYVETGRALRRAISHAVAQWILEVARKQWPGITENEIEERLDDLGKRFFDEDSPARRHFDEKASGIIQSHRNAGILAPEQETIVGILRRFIRTPSFLVRYFGLSARIDEEAIERAFKVENASGFSLSSMFEAFLDFISERCDAEERSDYLEALGSVQTGSHRIKTGNLLENEEDVGEALPNVRLVNGRTGKEARHKLMLTFNTPFYPEILIASAVLAEGVDLHLNCRHVIHHDLCWNPSTLEQRTGRIDRINAKAERCGHPIELYLPYVSGTQDEKMYRVMTDRERWFKVVMGEKYNTDSAAIDKLVERVPLPIKLAEKLAFRLECNDGEV
jgi:superfamily II DNA or RNA helicase